MATLTTTGFQSHSDWMSKRNAFFRSAIATLVVSIILSDQRFGAFLLGALTPADNALRLAPILSAATWIIWLAFTALGTVAIRRHRGDPTSLS